LSGYNGNHPQPLLGKEGGVETKILPLPKGEIEGVAGGSQ